MMHGKPNPSAARTLAGHKQHEGPNTHAVRDGAQENLPATRRKRPGRTKVQEALAFETGRAVGQAEGKASALAAAVTAACADDDALLRNLLELMGAAADLARAIAARYALTGQLEEHTLGFASTGLRWMLPATVDDNYAHSAGGYLVALCRQLGRDPEDVLRANGWTREGA